MDDFEDIRGAVVPFRVCVRDLQPAATGGLFDAGPYRRDRDTDKAQNHAFAVPADARSEVGGRQVASVPE